MHRRSLVGLVIYISDIKWTVSWDGFGFCWRKQEDLTWTGVEACFKVFQGFLENKTIKNKSQLACCFCLTKKLAALFRSYYLSQRKGGVSFPRTCEWFTGIFHCLLPQISAAFCGILDIQGVKLLMRVASLTFFQTITYILVHIYNLEFEWLTNLAPIVGQNLREDVWLGLAAQASGTPLLRIL